MAGFRMCHGHCIACGGFISFNVTYVPSITVNGKREPLCRTCFERWNTLHRTDKGLKPLPIHPDAYEPEEV